MPSTKESVVPKLLAKDRDELSSIVHTIACPQCAAKPGEPCTYKETTSPKKRKGTHDARFFALKKARRTKNKKPISASKYGNVQGHNKEDLRPLASRRLTMREMRDCGAWVPLEEERD